MAEQVGFAKLCGQGLEYVVQKYTITMGRCSKTTTVDLTLGNNMNLSRHHASIAYNFDSGESRCLLARSRGGNSNGHRPRYAAAPGLRTMSSSWPTLGFPPDRVPSGLE